MIPGEDRTLTAASDLSAGSRLGPYRIERRIGAGGMGQVFSATDTRLNRGVAIKTSGAGFGERFTREARAIAQLNHPNICALYDVGPNYLVMELLEGETLADALKRGPLPLSRVYRLGAQIADALAAAHSKGIVHRDLKPGNIMISKSGAKVLDFGIAKSAGDETLTAAHAAIGTPAYMAPEQREGRECDARSDIYALGLVLREMATGLRSGDLAGMPQQFAHIVGRCLEPDPADRWQAASDVRRELEWAAAVEPSKPVPAPVRSGALLARAVAGALLLALIISAIALYRRTPARNPASSEFILNLSQPSEVIFGMPVPSPDGRLLAFASTDLHGVTSLWIRPLDSVTAHKLPGTEGSAGEIIWSPDGAWIGFYAGGMLKKIHPSGGPAETIAAIAGFQDAGWGSRGDIVFRSTNRIALFRIRDSGGPATPLTKLNAALTENSHRYPTFLPDGIHFLYVSRCAERANNALYLASVDSPEVRKIMPAQARVSYVQGALLFYRDGTLMAQHFDPGAAQLSGEAVPVLTGIGYNAPSIQAAYRASAGGELLIGGSANAANSYLVSYTRSGEETGRLGDRNSYNQPRISPDGSRLAFDGPDPQTGNRDIWSIEIPRGITSRLTDNVANDWYPVWSPDGKQLAFSSDRDGGQKLKPYLKSSMDPGSGESPLGGATDPIYDWSRDGQWMAFASSNLTIARALRPASTFVFVASSAHINDARFSPDGKWIAYGADESGRAEIYVRPFSGEPAGPSGKVQISDRGGDYPVWSPSGTELYFMSADSSIYAADTRGLGKASGIPPLVRLFQACPGTGASGPPVAGNPYNYDFDTHDGRTFLVVCRAEPPGRFTVLTNWKFPQ